MCETVEESKATDVAATGKAAPKNGFWAVRFSFWGLLAAAVTITGIATGLGFFARALWVLDLFCAFRVQYAMSLAAAAVLFACGRRWRWFTVSAVLATVNAALILPVYIGSSTPGPEHALRVVTMNVHTGNTNYQAVNAFLLEADADVILLMEVNPQWWEELEPVRQRYPHCEQSLRTDNFGIAMLSKRPFESIQKVYITDDSLVTLDARLHHAGSVVRLIGTHPLPPTSSAYAQKRNEQLHKLALRCASEPLPTLLLGDLNTVPWSPHFRDLLKDGDLRDSRQGFGNQPSWPQTNPLLLIPIDHVLISDNLQVHNRQLGPDCGSDHRPVLVDCSVK